MKHPGDFGDIPDILSRLKLGERIETRETVCQRKDGCNTHVSLVVLTNVSKHARATRVVIRLEQRPLGCIIGDDGVGSAAAVLAQRGEQRLGLLGIQGRLKTVSGALQINSSPGQGAELVITIPLET